MLLSLIVIASHLNPLGKIGNQIRYLTPDEQKYVINNIQPEGIDISKLTESINNFQQNKLTLEFVHGLFDGDGSLTVYFVKPSEAKSLKRVSTNNPPLEEINPTPDNIEVGVGETKFYIGCSFTVVQDKHNLSLLNEVKSFFNNAGGIHEIGSNCSLYKVSSKSALTSIILPKMVNRESLDWVDYSESVAIDLVSPGLSLPLLKYNKVYYTCKILKFLSSPLFTELKEKGVLDTSLASSNKVENINKVIIWSYYVSEQSDNITLKKYVENFKQK